MKIEYPKWLYHAAKPARLVNDIHEHREQCPGDDWKEAPVPTQAVAEKAVTALTSPHTPDPGSVDDLRAKAEREGLWEAPIAAVIGSLSKVTDLAMLQRVRTFEEQNPRKEGPRKRVLDAIDAAMKALSTQETV